MAQFHQIPWTAMQAQNWLNSESSTAPQDAAVLDHLQLRSNETGILEVGCADGSFAISAHRVLRCQSNNPAKVVGIDNCQFMVSRARQNLAAEVSTDPQIRITVEFLMMDLTAFNNPANANIIMAHFPRGISTIVIMSVLHDLRSPVTVRDIRSLTSLLNVGGRIIFSTVPQPMVWGSAVFIDSARRHIGMVNLCPPNFIQAAVETTRNLCRAVLGAGPGGAPVNISAPGCVWMGTVFENFISRTANGPISGVRVNPVATFNPMQRRFYNTSHPRVIYGDSAVAFTNAVASEIIATMPAHPVSTGTHQQMMQIFMGGNGMRCMQNWITRLFDQHGDSYDAVQRVIQSNLAGISDHHGLREAQAFRLVEASVLVTIHRL